LLRPAAARFPIIGGTPLRDRQDPDGGGEPVLNLVPPVPPTADRGAGWPLCGVGIKHRA